MLKIDIEDKTIQDLVAKINYKVENELYDEVGEFTMDYFLLSSLVYNYDIEHSSVNLLNFIEKLPVQEGVCEYKWVIQETKPESDE